MASIIGFRKYFTSEIKRIDSLINESTDSFTVDRLLYEKWSTLEEWLIYVDDCKPSKSQSNEYDKIVKLQNEIQLPNARHIHTAYECVYTINEDLGEEEMFIDMVYQRIFERLLNKVYDNRCYYTNFLKAGADNYLDTVVGFIKCMEENN